MAIKALTVEESKGWLEMIESIDAEESDFLIPVPVEGNQ